MKKTEETKRSLLAYFLIMFFVFVGIDFVITVFPSLMTELSTTYKYGDELIAEIFYAFMALIVMLLFHNSYVFTDKQEKFSKSLYFGIPMLILTFINFTGSVLSLESFPLGNFINVFVLCIFIGITEEFLCRGWLQNEFLERYGNDKKGVILSITCSSLIFGLMHLTNLFSQDLFSTILQIVNAGALGFLLGTIYYKTKNIWSVIFLHAAWDFAIFLGEIDLIKDCTYNNPTTAIVIIEGVSILIVSLFWLASALLVIKQTNYPDKKASKKKNNLTGVIIAIVVLGICTLLPFENLSKDFENYQVCYSYSKTKINNDYVAHYPGLKKYDISYTKNTATLVMGDDETDIENIELNINYNFSFERNEDNKLVVTNVNTGYSVTLDYYLPYNYQFEVLENTDGYVVLVQEDDFETTIYYNDYLLKSNLSNDDEFLDEFKKSFIKYELPLINEIGYITFEGSDNKIPYFYSKNYDHFMIMNGDLFLVK